MSLKAIDSRRDRSSGEMSCQSGTARNSFRFCDFRARVELLIRKISAATPCCRRSHSRLFRLLLRGFLSFLQSLFPESLYTQQGFIPSGGEVCSSKFSMPTTFNFVPLFWVLWPLSRTWISSRLWTAFVIKSGLQKFAMLQSVCSERACVLAIWFIWSLRDVVTREALRGGNSASILSFNSSGKPWIKASLFSSPYPYLFCSSVACSRMSFRNRGSTWSLSQAKYLSLLAPGPVHEKAP